MTKTPAAKTSAEDDFIARYFAPIAGAGALALRDDAAVLQPPPGCELVLTVDTLVAGVHFLADDPPASIARKALRVNLSDLAAKGADPLGFLLSFAMPADAQSPVRGSAWLSAFSKALGEDANAYCCLLLGGDSVSTPGPLTLSITAFGSVPAGEMALRTGARAGDVILVSGTIGDAALGLQCLQDKPPEWCTRLSDKDCAFLISRYREPQPRNAIAQLVRSYAHGSMDISDGLAGDLAKMMRVSNVSARIDSSLVPLSDAAKAAVALDDTCLETVLTGGDDYEIACTMAPDKTDAFIDTANAAGVEVTAIGKVIAAAQADVSFIDAQGRNLKFARRSYSHF